MSTTSDASSSSLNPFLLVMVVVAVGGVIFALNRASIWYAPAILAAAVVGMVALAVRHAREKKLDRQQASRVNYSRLASMSLAPSVSWLKANVRGHDPVIEAVVSEIDRNLRLARQGRTLGAFLLVGPTGTGKTFLGHLIAEALYPSTAPVVLRMNTYKHPDDVFTLIGPPAGREGYQLGGTLTRPVLEHPHRVIILDELEKAHRDLHHCLYDILDTATCREKSSGKLVDFSGCVFLATCNAGVDAIRAIHRHTPDAVVRLTRSRDALADVGGFDKAFLARWNGLFFMDQLAPLHVAEVTCLELAKQWRDYGIDLQYASPQLILEAVQRNEDFKSYGVRELGAYIKSKTSYAIIEAREKGIPKVWLGVAPDGSLKFTEKPAP